MCLSRQAIKTHVPKIDHKLGVKSRARAGKRACDTHLLDRQATQAPTAVVFAATAA
jgi:ATP/maltotriose-dependent transcriptional regulator MalT